ncbi:MAG: hydroxymethylglutaryl-CoA reductase [Patescibacteria group bacterium]|nr:hydroxymethylglutaryl-CoA reductase [Patescibacteria group bacterium]
MTLRSLNPVSRREYLCTELGVSLPAIERALADTEDSVRIENLVGAVSIPLGVAGPVQIHGESVSGKRFVPLATTEGALVASVNRGCKAITDSGGVFTASDDTGMTRGPVFVTASLADSRKLEAWLARNENLIREAAESTSAHLSYVSMQVRALARSVYVRFVFRTGQAMGMNMVTLATQKIVELVEDKTNARCVAVAGNYDIDKKPAWLNVIENRGKRVRAEAVIHSTVISSVLKTSASAINETWVEKCVQGSYLAGSLGFNCQFANIVAAVFAATGQDLAHVVEGSAGITTVQVLEGGDLYCAVYLPAVLTATVGGGTKYKTQQEAHAILGNPDASGLAEIIGAAVLAGELSLLASLSVHTLARSHRELGR